MRHIWVTLVGGKRPEQGHVMSKPKLNMHRDNTTDWRGPCLCPFGGRPFTLDGVSVSTPENFTLTLRLPANDARRIVTTMEDPATARQTVRNLKLKQFVWWDGRMIETNSEEFEILFERMMRARFRKDRRAIAALMASEGMRLVHERVSPRSPLSFVPIKLYRRILGMFRDELFKTGLIAKTVAA